jgi:LMBR1 domain-containing protein 1
MAFLVLFFFSSSIVGIASIGIRFLWVRLFEIRKGHTTPQALLVATVMLTLIMLAVNYSITMIVAPQYAIYGAQTFCSNPTDHPDDQPNCSEHPELVKPCSELSSDYSSKNVCTPTVASTFLNRVTFNFPFFGGLAFWAQFAFLGVFLIVFGTSLFRTPKLNTSQLDEDAEADEEEGLLASTGRRFGATWQDIRGKPKKPSRGAAGRAIRGDDTQEDD